MTLPSKMRGHRHFIGGPPPGERRAALASLLSRHHHHPGWLPPSPVHPRSNRGSQSGRGISRGRCGYGELKERVPGPGKSQQFQHSDFQSHRYKLTRHAGRYRQIGALFALGGRERKTRGQRRRRGTQNDVSPNCFAVPRIGANSRPREKWRAKQKERVGLTVINAVSAPRSGK